MPSSELACSWARTGFAARVEWPSCSANAIPSSSSLAHSRSTHPPAHPVCFPMDLVHRVAPLAGGPRVVGEGRYSVFEKRPFIHFSPCTGRRRSRPRGAYPEAWWAVCCLLLWCSVGCADQSWGLLPSLGRGGRGVCGGGQLGGSCRGRDFVSGGLEGGVLRVWSFRFGGRPSERMRCGAARLVVCLACLQRHLLAFDPGRIGQSSLCCGGAGGVGHDYVSKHGLTLGV